MQTAIKCKGCTKPLGTIETSAIKRSITLVCPVCGAVHVVRPAPAVRYFVALDTAHH